jgi:hypothetical protein
MAWGDILEKIFVGVVTAIVLGALVLLWNLGTGGTLIQALGGVTKAESEADKGQLNTSILARASVPSGAVVAFDQDTCPDGWEPFLEANARTIIGAGNPANAPGLNIDEAARELKPHTRRERGGEQVRAELKPAPSVGGGDHSLTTTLFPTSH